MGAWYTACAREDSSAVQRFHPDHPFFRDSLVGVSDADVHDSAAKDSDPRWVVTGEAPKVVAWTVVVGKACFEVSHPEWVLLLI